MTLMRPICTTIDSSGAGTSTARLMPMLLTSTTTKTISPMHQRQREVERALALLQRFHIAVEEHPARFTGEPRPDDRLLAVLADGPPGTVGHNLQVALFHHACAIRHA